MFLSYFGICPDGNFTCNHLWFVPYLFVLSMIALPVFATSLSRSVLGFAILSVRTGNTGVAARYLFVVIASSLVTVITYEVLVGRWRLARFLFGMKRRGRLRLDKRRTDEGNQFIH